MSYNVGDYVIYTRSTNKFVTKGKVYRVAYIDVNALGLDCNHPHVGSTTWWVHESDVERDYKDEEIEILDE